MKAKRFILMLLVMLGSVTGAWAQTVLSGTGNKEYALTTYSEDPDKGWTTDGSEAWIIVGFPKTGTTDVYEQCYIGSYTLKPCATTFKDTFGGMDRYDPINTPNFSKLEGGNDQTDWTLLQEGNVNLNYTPIGVPSVEVTLNTTESYKYYRLTFSREGVETIMLKQISFTFTCYSTLEGSGTESAPYIIKTPQEWYLFERVAQDNPNACCKFDADITLIDHSPIYNLKDYAGTIDGNNHVLKNVPSPGLFSNIGAAKVKNLGIVNGSIDCTQSVCGAFAANAKGTTFTM